MRNATLVAAALLTWQALTPSQGSVIVFVSTRDNPTLDPAVDPVRTFLAAEIYRMEGDGTNPQRITNNAFGDGFPAVSPDGSRIVFDSNRLRTEAEPLNTSDLFLMNADGSGQRALVRGSSATWSPDGKRIAFHASASGTGQPINTNPGAATTDADIFVVNVEALLAGRARPENITNNPAAVDDDPDWSPDARQIVFTSHAVTDSTDNHVTAEIYVVTPDEKGTPTRLTNNADEERAPTWSRDGKRILFSCRKGVPAQPGGIPTFELCVMNADGSELRQLTHNAVAELTPSWSPDGRQILFHRPVGGRGRFQLFMNSDDGSHETQLTFPPGVNAFANWTR
jgi:Tol biopolymer transport system component